MWKKGKVLAVSSPGGHWVQLNKICNQLENQYHIVYASPRDQYKLTSKDERVIHNIMDASSDTKWKVLPLACQLLILVLKERPATIISTGAAPGAVAILLGKIVGIKTIWIDSIANVHSLSRSGRMVQAYADIVLTQWSNLSDGEKVHYKGSIL